MVASLFVELIPVWILLALVVLFLLFALLARVQKGRFVRPIVKLANGDWLVGDHADRYTYDFHETEFYLADVRWIKLDIAKVQTKGTLLDKVDLSKVDEIGFVDLTPGSGHGLGGFSDVGWMEVYGKPVRRDVQVSK